MSEWISIVGWRRFQHYDPAKRQPPWIKTYVELMSDHDYLELSEHRALILHRLWLEYASTRCRLPLDTRSLSRRLFLRVTRADIDSLCDAGFISIVASKALAEGYHGASPRAHASETETEVEPPPTPPSRGGRENGSAGQRHFTGCRYVYNGRAPSYVYDPLGVDRPPQNWPHEKPSRDMIRKALEPQELVRP